MPVELSGQQREGGTQVSYSVINDLGFNAGLVRYAHRPLLKEQSIWATDMEFGAYAQVLGDIRIASGAKIGAMSVVLCDVPAGATAVGNPARILKRAV